MRPLAALALASTLSACFPDSPHARRIAYAAEGATMAAGLVVLALTKAPSQCDRRDTPCMDRAEQGESLGLTLLFGGLIAAFVTVVSAKDAPAAAAAPAPAPP